jgi:hypothetical protein
LNSKSKNLFMVIYFTFLMFIGHIAYGDTAGMQNVTGGWGTRINENWTTGGITYGFGFVVKSTITITSLGIYDFNGDGLYNSHDIGLWDIGGTFLGSVTIPDGTGATLEQGFRYVTLTTPITLDPGTYAVGAWYIALNGAVEDEYLVDMKQFGMGDTLTWNVAPEIAWLDTRGESASALTFPSVWSSYGLVGPNFQFETAGGGSGNTSVPEPSTLLLLGSGMVGLVGYGRRRFKK